MRNEDWKRMTEELPSVRLPGSKSNDPGRFALCF